MMQMTFRWYGEGNDQIKLSDIKQIPGVTGILSWSAQTMPEIGRASCRERVSSCV